MNRLLSFSSQYRKPIPPHFIVSWIISVIIFVPHNRNPLSIPFHKPEIIYKAGERFLKNIYLSYTLQISSYICPFFIWGALQILETHNFLWSKLYFQIDSDSVNVKSNICALMSSEAVPRCEALYR